MLDGKKVVFRFGGDFDPIPMDKYTVQIADVNPEVKFNKFKGEEEEKLNFKFVILDDKPLGDGKGSTKGRYLWHAMTPSFNQKSWLLKFVKAVMGREPTKEELENFDPDSVVGKQVDVMVEQKPSSDGSAIFNNIVSYAKTVRPLAAVEATRAGQATVEKSTKAAIAQVEIPPLNPEAADPFLDELEADEAKPSVTSVTDNANETDEDPEVLEAKLKLAQAKAAKAKGAVKK